jgi:acetoin utilization protein AcuC
LEWIALKSNKVGIVYHEKYSQYDLGAGHPFRGDRFVNAARFFQEHGLFERPNVAMLEPKSATKRDLLRVHDEDYVNLIFRLARENRPYDIETPVSPQILEASLLIVGGALEAGKALYKGLIECAVALGCGFHHAGRNYGGGFCLFNDIAVLVEFLRREYGLKRILIFDHDVHFGNGTSDIYYEDPDVLFISFHQDPRTIYPGTGFVEQIGRGAGEGFNVNVSLPPQTGDQSYLYALREVFVPLAEEFEPELIVTNGGSDPHFADMLGNLRLTVSGFFMLSKTIREVAKKVCEGKVILMPGSGYNPAVLPHCWYALAAGIAGLEKVDITDPYTPPVEPKFIRLKVEDMLRDLKRILRKYWKCFS